MIHSLKEGTVASNYSSGFPTVLWIWIKRRDWPAENQWKAAVLCIHIYACADNRDNFIVQKNIFTYITELNFWAKM